MNQEQVDELAAVLKESEANQTMLQHFTAYHQTTARDLLGRRMAETPPDHHGG